MGLTNDKPQQVVATYTVLLEILQRVTELTSDPQAFEKMVKAAFSLAKSEEAKVGEARDTIAKYDALVEEQRKERAALDIYSDDLTKRKQELDNSARKSEERNNSLNKREKELNEWEDELKKIVEKTQQEKTQIALTLARYEKDKGLFDAEKKEFAEYKAEIKETADKMKEMTGGL